MKHIIKLSTQYGSQLRTRMMIEQLESIITDEDEYLIDFEGIEQISRSAADELYTMLHAKRNVEVVHMSTFVCKMLDAVTLGRFNPRKRDIGSQPQIISCPTLQSVSQCLIG